LKGPRNVAPRTPRQGPSDNKSPCRLLAAVPSGEPHPKDSLCKTAAELRKRRPGIQFITPIPREPFISPRTRDGRYLFGGVDPLRQWQCLTGRRCSVCGRPLVEQPGDRLILLMRLSDLPHRRTGEPGLDPVCAAYTQAACPMIAGRL